jgi:hypothetical protein
MIEQRVVAFEPEFERTRAINLHENGGERERFNAYVRRQLETHLGERFNVLLSTTRYEIRNNQIFGENMDESFMDVLIRGRNYRRLHGDPIDFDREDAEVFGFAKIETALAASDAEVGTMMFSISQPGIEAEVVGQPESIYKHNFYDIFTLQEDEKGRYIEARRYSSGLSLAETTDKLIRAEMLPKDAKPTAEEFLANPIGINPKTSLFNTADRVHAFLHREHQYLPKDIHDNAIRMVQSLISRYADSVENDPLNARAQNLYLNATLNGFDMAVEVASEQNSASVNAMHAYALETMFSSRSSVDMLGNKSVRVVATGCGPSGGFGDKGENSAFSVSEFGLGHDKYGDRTFPCPNEGCGKIITRPNNELVENCPYCGTDVRC